MLVIPPLQVVIQRLFRRNIGDREESSAGTSEATEPTVERLRLAFTANGKRKK